MAADLNSDGFTTPGSISILTPEQPKHKEIRRIIAVFFGRKIAVIGLILFLLLIFTAIFAPWLTDYDPNKVDIINKLQPPSREHWLGTDSVGRDVLSRIVYGSRTSLIVGIGAVGLATLVGQLLGLIAAYFGGWVHAVIMRCIDTVMAIPMLLSALLLAVVLGSGMFNVIIALSVGMVSIHCRMMCGQAMSVKQNDYVLAAKAMGQGGVRIMLKQIFPNAFPPLLVVMTIGLGATILAQASLSFLGIGIAPPTPAWGGMINDGYKYLIQNPILSIAPGVAIGLTVFGVNMMGDGLRDALDPRLRGVI